MAEQLIKKIGGEYSNVMPKSWIEAITDKSTGESLTHILQGFNMYFLSYTGNTEQTRCQVPKILRKKGLWITYVKYDGNVYTEWYNSNDIDDKSWGNSSNWRIGNNELVGDLTISANGNWVINGNETEFKAIGEKGNTPLIRIANNKLQVSYDTGNTYHNVDDNPVYTQIRTYNNKLQISTDLGANWADASDEIAAYFRFNSGQGNNVGSIQISRNNKDWNDLSGNFVNNLHISKYIGADETLPTSGIAEGTIYAKGPTYADSDTSHSNPIYRLWVYAYKGSTLAWQDNGEFTSISAGITQELGDSENLVVSQRRVSQEIIQGGVYDVSYHNNNAVFESLQALLSSSSLSILIPALVRHGGMSIKFIQGSVPSSDNKYVQYRLMKNTWSTTVSDWQGVDDEPVVGSENLVKSGGVAYSINQLKNSGYFYAGIATPTTNPGTPDGPVFYIANGKGTYTNFGGINVTEDEVVVLYYDTVWHKDATGIASNNKLTELGMIINEIADTNIQPPVEGKNLFNVATIKDGYNVSDSGGEFVNENHSISEYISISGTTNIVVSANADIRNDIKFALYDASKATIVGSVLRIPTLTLDSSITRYYYTIVTNGAAYIRFSALTAYFPIREFQIEKGTTPTSFEDYIDPTPQVSTQVKEIAIPQYTEYKQKVDALDDIVSVSVYRNRFDGTYVQKKYINQTNGVSKSGDNYGHTNFINIEGDSEFVVVSSMRSMVNGGIRYAQYTDKSEDSFIPNSGAIVTDASLFILDSATGRTYFKIPRNPNAKYLRFSCVIAIFTSGLYDIQVELASTPTSYGKYYEPTKTINQKFLQTAKGSFGSKSSLASGEMLTLDTNCVKKNKRLAFLAKINSFSAVEVGHGASSSYGFYMKVDSEKVYFVQNGTSGSSLTHGLTINGYIGIVIKVGNQGNFSFTINTQSAKYESPREYNGWKGYQGAIFAKSVGSSLTDCTLSWMCEDYEKDIYMFGDSYFSHESQTRWPYWMINWGFDNALMDAYPGKASAEAYESFLNALEHKIPKFVIWCLGMNDPDSTTAVNPTWKSVVEKVISKCNTYGITPILATIPNTPSDTYSNNFKNEYIKESGYRYIDFANAVGAEERGSGWDYDYLETGANPNIHPSANGARVLALRALTDVPELMGNIIR